MNVHKALLAVAIALPGYVHAGGFSSDQLCKAAIAMEMGRPADTMKTMRRGDMPEISYRRPDGDRFRYRCKVVGIGSSGQPSLLTLPVGGVGVKVSGMLR